MTDAKLLSEGENGDDEDDDFIALWEALTGYTYFTGFPPALFYTYCNNKPALYNKPGWLSHLCIFGLCRGVI